MEKFLENMMKKEKHKLTCAYAILSWADIAVVLHSDISEKENLIKELKNTSRIKSSEHCLLSCCYAIYKFEKKESLKEIMHFLESENYQMFLLSSYD